MAPTSPSRQYRDAGLRRVGAITRWTVAGALAGTGLFAGLAAHAGRGVSASSPKPVVAGTTSGSGAIATRSGDDGGGFTPTTQYTPPAVTLAPPNAVAQVGSGAS